MVAGTLLFIGQYFTESTKASSVLTRIVTGTLYHMLSCAALMAQDRTQTEKKKARNLKKKNSKNTFLVTDLYKGRGKKKERK